MEKLKVSELKKHLSQYSQKELIQFIVELHKSNKEVQQYCATKFLGETAIEALFDETFKKVKHEFFPERGAEKLRLAEAKKAISHFEKITGDVARTLELRMIYVELGVSFAVMYGDMYESFYYSIETMYAKVTAACEADEETYKHYATRLEKVITDTEDMGWGFHEVLCDMYDEISFVQTEE